MPSTVKPAAAVKKRYKASSLPELLLVLGLGSLMLFTVSRFYSDLFHLQFQHHQQLSLQKTAHQLLDYIQHHFLHAGYQGPHRTESNFDLFRADKAYLVEKQCLVLIHDLNGDGCLGSRVRNQCTHQDKNILKDTLKEIVALKVENKQLLTLAKQEKLTQCRQESCRRILHRCDQIKWEKIADIQDTQIERLHFQWEKPDQLLKIELTLSALQNPSLRYSATAYAYLLNGAP